MREGWMIDANGHRVWWYHLLLVAMQVRGQPCLPCEVDKRLGQHTEDYIRHLSKKLPTSHAEEKSCPECC